MKGEGDKSRLVSQEPVGCRPMLGVKSIGQVKCIHTNAHRVGNKQEVLEGTVQQGSCDTAAIMEMCCVHHWTAAVQLFIRDRQARTGRLPSSENQGPFQLHRAQGQGQYGLVPVGENQGERGSPNQDEEPDEIP